MYKLCVALCAVELPNYMTHFQWDMAKYGMLMYCVLLCVQWSCRTTWHTSSGTWPSMACWCIVCCSVYSGAAELHDTLPVGHGQVWHVDVLYVALCTVELPNYMTHFQWDMAKYGMLMYCVLLCVQWSCRTTWHTSSGTWPSMACWCIVCCSVCSGAAELHDTLPVGHGQVWHVDVLCIALCTVELPNYMTHFQWDMAKYGMLMYCMLLCVQWSCRTTWHTSSGTWPSMACWCIVCCSVCSGAAELHDTLPVGHGQVWHVDVLCVALCTVELPNYMTHFQWDMAKYGMLMYCLLLCVQWSCRTTWHTSSGTWPSMACWCINCMLLCVQWSCRTTWHTSSGTWPSMACWCIVCCSVCSGAAELHDTLPVGHGQVWHVDV